MPKQGAENSNDGNTAIRFFRDPDVAAEITGVDRELIHIFGIIITEVQRICKTNMATLHRSI